MLTFGLLTTAAVHGTPIQSRSQSAILNVTPKLQKASSIKHVIFYTKVQAKVVKQLSPKKLFSDNDDEGFEKGSFLQTFSEGLPDRVIF